MASILAPGVSRKRAFAAGVIVAFALVLAALLVAKSSGELHPPLSRGQAEAAARADPQVRKFLAAQGFTSAKTIALDKTHWRVTFFNHAKTVLDASVGPGGRIDAVQGHAPGVHATGSNILWNRAALIGLALLFVAATAVVPLRRVRNLDALVIAGGLVAVLILYDSRIVAGDAWAGGAVLAYVMARCGWTALCSPREQEPAKPLYAAILQSLPPESRRRIAIIVASATLLAGTVITVTATQISDVAFAGMAGATAIQRGDAPYGHVTKEVVHGDTYPLFTYVMYLPFSLITPVDDSFDDLDGALDLNAIALVAAALLAYSLALRTSARDRGYGLAMAVAWLACPAVLLAASGGGNDVPTAFLVMAGLAAFAMPLVSTGALALATAAKLGPVAGLLLWIASLPRRAWAPAIAVTGAVAAGCLVLLIALGGTGAISDMLDALAFQFRRGSYHCIWTQLGSRTAQAVFQAAVLTFIGTAAVHVARTRERQTLRSVCALAAAGILGLQLAANYWTFAYFVWALPFILVGLFPATPLRSPPSARAAP